MGSTFLNNSYCFQYYEGVLLPEGLLCREPQNFDVRLSVRPSVRPFVRCHLFEPLFGPRNVQYCFKYPNRVLKKSEKRGVPLDPVRKQILMWKKVDPKSDQFWLTSS